MNSEGLLRLPSERLYAGELEVLSRSDGDPCPAGWKLSPRAVLKFITGGIENGVEIKPKYLGSRRLVEIAVATLLTDRSLLLLGEPGTGKTWLSENLAAAVCGDSSKVVQGTAGTGEEHIRYSWNYAMLISEGPTEKALIKSPVCRAMETGTLARFEEISRCASEVQDSLISILSEKCISIPELGRDVAALRGFSIIATANTRDRGVNQMSSALKRRFNTVVLPAPADLETEVDIVTRRVAEISGSYRLDAAPPAQEVVYKIVTIFRELRQGITVDNKQKIKPLHGAVSAADAISLLTGAMALAASFGNGVISYGDLAASLNGIIIRDEERDTLPWREYLETVMRKRGKEWRELYDACRELMD